MKDNLSIVITIIVLVLLMVIFPLYNFFERQDDMSYNLVLKATTNFADKVMNNGYIDQDTYDKFVAELANTGNVYDIQIEAHRKVLILDEDNTSYSEQSYIDYIDDIFNKINDTSGTVDANLMARSLKNNIYTLNQKDEFYVKVKNSNKTMAGALFNIIIPTSDKTRIEVNYGGIVKNNAWAKVDATYIGHKQAPSKPKLYLSKADGSDSREITNDSGVYEILKTDIVDNGYVIRAESAAFEGNTITNYFWKITNTNTLESFERKFSDPKLTDTGYTLNDIYRLEVYVVDNQSYKSESTQIEIKIVENISVEETTVKKGDIDGNDVIDTADQTLLQQYLNHEITFSSAQLQNADIDSNGTINSKDLDFLIEIINNGGYILGDVNADYKIDINDLTMVQDDINGITALTEDQKKRADMNGDNVIDSLDLTAISSKMS